MNTQQVDTVTSAMARGGSRRIVLRRLAGGVPRLPHRFVALIATVIILSLLAVPATATHSWGNYHWARTRNPFTIPVGDNVSGAWDTALDVAILGRAATSSAPALPGWNVATPLDLKKEAGRTTAKTCKAVPGTIQVCNYAYGKKGWEGIAQIWTNGDHITQATAKMNDTYFTTAYYPANELQPERQLVMCQEIAHGFGLDHNNENFDDVNTGTCMDYGNSPLGPPNNEGPNQHDFDQLVTIHTHTDTTSTTGAATSTTAAAEADVSEDPSTWGEVIEHDGKGRPSHFRKDLGNGKKVFTFVIYAEDEPGLIPDPGTGTDGAVAPGVPQSGKKDKKDKVKAEDGKKDKDRDHKRDHGKHRH